MPHLVLTQPGQVPQEPLVRLLAHAVWPPTEERAVAVLADRRDGDQVAVYVAMDNGMPVGLIRMRRSGARSAEITHIAVTPERRRTGLGQFMVRELLAIERLGRVVAETDRDAVGFYIRCGFEVQSLGEKYPGVERVHCVLDRTSWS